MTRAAGTTVTATVMATAMASALAGCGGGISSELEGIYTIDEWTANTSSCEAEGNSVLPTKSQQWFYVRTESFRGTDFLNVALCASEPTCASEAAGAAIEFDGWAFEDGSDDGGWIGAQADVEVAPGSGECAGTVSNDTMTMAPMAAGVVRIESRTRQTRTFAPDSEGFCVSDDAIAASSGEPCGRYEAITATLSAPLQ